MKVLSNTNKKISCISFKFQKCLFGSNNKVKEEKLTDLYNLKRKLGKPNITRFVDKDKFELKNFRLVTKKSKQYTNIAAAVAKSGYIPPKTKVNPAPVSPYLGPFVIENPDIETKTYHWCSCGLSKKQPFCDRSHQGTAFKPVNFKLGQKVDKIELCGCKYSSKAPFCDGTTCKKLTSVEEKKNKTKLNSLV